MLNCPCYNTNGEEGWCLETKGFDICFCNGNPVQCDFFPAVRQQAIYSLLGENKDFRMRLMRRYLSGLLMR